jgi:Flp pilus assembly protein TadD
MQVELLGDADHGSGPADAADATTENEVLLSDTREPETPEAAGPPGEPRDVREPADRWVKAVGQLRPTLRPPSRRSVRKDPAGQPAANGAHPPEPVSGEAYVAARDHAAAGVRPAGEPLARAKDLVQQGRVQEAIQLYLGILTVNPSNLKAHNNLGVLYDELKRFDSALEHFQEAERLSPENVEVLANYASTLTSLARYDEAEELLRRAQRLAPEDPRARLAVGILHFRRGLYQQAEVELRLVCANDPTHGPAFYYRGEALNRLGRYDEAGEAMEQAIELMPSDPRPFYTLGHLYDRSHRTEDAAEMYRRARRLQSR